MFDKARAFLLSLTIIAVLLFSAVGTTVVYADGGTPPDAPPAETSGGETEEAEEAEESDAEPAEGSGKSGPGTSDTIETPESPDAEATPAPTEEVAPPVEG